MRGLVLIVLVQLLMHTNPGHGQSYEVSRVEDGAFAFKASGRSFNKKSSLVRESVLLNHPESPVELASNNLNFTLREGRFRYHIVTEIVVKKAVRAVRITHMLFSVFGEHMGNLSQLETQDVELGERPFRGSWSAGSNDYRRQLTTVSFVSKVRLSNGTIWKSDDKELAIALQSLGLSAVGENMLGDESMQKPSSRLSVDLARLECLAEKESKIRS